MTDLPEAYQPRGPVGTFVRFLRSWWKADSYLNSTGLKRSYRENRPVNANGQALPWFNYPLIRLLEERLKDTHRVFEYGSGYSTLFFARLCASVSSVEHNDSWVDLLEPKLPANASVNRCPAGPRYQAAAESAASADTTFDLVLVDGPDRELCLPFAAQALSPQGVIILDDSHRKVYQEAIAELQTLGFRSLRFYGPKPNALIEAQSMLLYRSDNILGL